MSSHSLSSCMQQHSQAHCTKLFTCAYGVLSALLLRAGEAMWADSMAALAGSWCHHAAADRHLQTVLQMLEPLHLLSSKQMADIETCYTTLLVSLRLHPPQS